MKNNQPLVKVAAVLLSLSALLAIEAAANAQKVKPVNTAVVIDSKGKRVGNIFGIGPPAGLAGSRVAVVLFNVDGRSFGLGVVQDRFLNLVGNGRLMFESTNCSGTPYIEPAHNPPALLGILPSTAFGPPGNMLYLEGADATPQTIMVQSKFEDGGCFPITNPVPIPTPFSVVPAVPAVDMYIEFTPPFAIRSAP